MLEQERKYFAENRDELLARYPGKFVLVKGDELIGTFNTIEEALADGARRFATESFLVRQVTAADEKEISIPALTLGLLRADSSHPV